MIALLALAGCRVMPGSAVGRSDASEGAGPTCPAERRVEGVIEGTFLVGTAPRVAAIDGASWRWGDAPVFSDVTTPDPSTGAFTLCLVPEPEIVDVYAKAFVAGWNDLDGDDRYDARAEPLCDRAGEGWTVDYLFYGTTYDGTGWTSGVGRVGLGSVVDSFSPRLDGDRCEI